MVYTMMGFQNWYWTPKNICINVWSSQPILLQSKFGMTYIQFFTATLIRVVLQSTLSICFHCWSFEEFLPKWLMIDLSLIYCSFLVLFGLPWLWSNLIKLEQIGSNWIKLDQIGLNLNQIDKTCSNVIKLVQT